MGRRNSYQSVGEQTSMGMGLWFIIIVVAVLWYGAYYSLSWLAN